jgi:hypothetical protein
MTENLLGICDQVAWTKIPPGLDCSPEPDNILFSHHNELKIVRTSVRKYNNIDNMKC